MYLVIPPTGYVCDVEKNISSEIVLVRKVDQGDAKSDLLFLVLFPIMCILLVAFRVIQSGIHSLELLHFACILAAVLFPIISINQDRSCVRIQYLSCVMDDSSEWKASDIRCRSNISTKTHVISDPVACQVKRQRGRIYRSYDLKRSRPFYCFVVGDLDSLSLHRLDFEGRGLLPEDVFVVAVSYDSALVEPDVLEKEIGLPAHFFKKMYRECDLRY